MPLRHGATLLAKVRVDAYNAELRHDGTFIGDRANKRAFQRSLDKWRENVHRAVGDPFNISTSQLYKDKCMLQDIFINGDYKAAGVILGAMEDFAQELAAVVQCLLKLDQWRDTEMIFVGGGFREGRVGEIAIGRTIAVLQTLGLSVDLVPIHHHPDRAGLVGSIYLAPATFTEHHDGILAVDVGGTNIRAGVVSCSGECVLGPLVWRHADDRPERNDAVKHLAIMLCDLSDRARQEAFKLSSFVGVGCPGMIRDDGRVERGGQNLPGNWQAVDFNLAQTLTHELAISWRRDVCVLMHNDAVIQGLSELPFIGEVERWGIITIGTGLGNARLSTITS
jgi:hypothetical protein